MEGSLRPGAEQGADEVDVLLALVDDLLGHVLEVVVALEGDELDEHGQVDPGDDLDVVLLEEAEAQVGGRAAEHVGEDDDAALLVDPLEALVDLPLGVLDVVVPADRDGLDVGRLAEDDGQGVQQLLGHAAVADDDASDHGSFVLPVSAPLYDKAAYL